ncbi:MAG: adenylate/guanylate cyclase domain-containing protein [bacterium]|nr:adenylate/guanylate cyclase domain-containing protein [bacterium]
MNTDVLSQKERQLQLVLALDQIRDRLETSHDPETMFQGILTLLGRQFQAEGAGMVVLDELSRTPEILLSVETPQEEAVELCKQAMALKLPAALPSITWPYTLGVQIVLDQQPLGGLFVGRRNRPFDEDEMLLMRVAESQIDSAVMQARSLWKLTQRNLELETIYRIDRLSDDDPDENNLIAAFTTLLVERFKPDLCLVLLSNIDSGEIVLRSVTDKTGTTADTMLAIQQKALHVKTTQSIPAPAGLNDIALLASPLIVAGAHLGVIVVGRSTPFSEGDQRLLMAMTSQMDSAIAHSRVIQQLTRRNRELETIYKIDNIRDISGDFDAMMQLVLAELCKSVISEVGYLMLYDENKEERLELKATTQENLLQTPGYLETIRQFSREALDAGEVVYYNDRDGVVKSIVAVPLILNERIIGVFGLVNSANPRGFTAEDRQLLTAITSQVDTAVFEQLERRRMRRVLSRSVDPKVLDHLLNKADSHILSGERVVLSVIFADLRGSTEWAERTNPEELVSTLNIYLGSMTDVIFKHGGTLDKFVGDEVIGLFGSPVYMEDHALRAVQCALEMQALHAKVQAELRLQGKEMPDMGVGISSGEVIAGELGSPVRTDFTAIGRVMNLGARLCSAAPAEKVIISQATYEMVKERVEAHSLEAVNLKGIGANVPAYELLRLKD